VTALDSLLASMLNTCGTKGPVTTAKQTPVDTYIYNK